MNRFVLRTSSDDDRTLVSTLNLVDLAGSERADRKFYFVNFDLILKWISLNQFYRNILSWITGVLSKASSTKKNMHTVIGTVKEAYSHLDKLRKNGFTLAHPKFGSTVREFNDKFASYMDNDDKNMKCSANHNFKKLFNGNIHIKFEEKLNVIQVSLIK